MEQKDTFGIFGLLLIAFIAWHSIGQEKSDIVSFSAACSNDTIVAPPEFASELGIERDRLISARDQCEIMTTGKHRFSINRSTESVTFRAGDLPWLTRLENCAILDNKNWNCEFSDRSGDIGFLDGKRTVSLSDFQKTYDTFPPEFYVKRWQYIVIDIWGVFGTPRAWWLIPKPESQISSNFF